MCRSCRTVEELENCFSNWMIANNKRLVTFGRDYFDNGFEGSVDYTVDLFEQDPRLMYLFGFDFSDLEATKRRTGYYERKSSNRSGSRGSSNSRRGTRTNSNRNQSYGNDEGYSLGGQFKSYLDGLKSMGGGSGKSFSLSEFIKSPLGVLIALALVFTFIYMVFGEAIYSFITSGAIFKVICFVIAGFASFGIIKSKNLGWPIYIKALVLFAVWVVLLNYDF